MAKVTQDACDACGKRVDNAVETQGWLRIDGSISRQWGAYLNGSYRSDYLKGSPLDFCSVRCLVRKLDEAAQKQGATPVRSVEDGTTIPVANDQPTLFERVRDEGLPQVEPAPPPPPLPIKSKPKGRTNPYPCSNCQANPSGRCDYHAPKSEDPALPHDTPDVEAGW